MLLLLAVILPLYAQKPKYVFLMIGDGMAVPQRMIADEFSRKINRGQLAMNTLPFHATTRTVSASSLVTDSAAAATAIACGEKTANGVVGYSKDFSRKLESVAVVAHKNGKKVGIITSVTINHATPAGFYAHRKHRSQYYSIGLDLIASGFEYFGGGGVARCDDRESPDFQGNIYDLAAKAGYKVVRNKADFVKLAPGVGKVLASGSPSSLPAGIDQDKSVPTLAEFTAKGIELLDNPNGFFMMVEGGRIDEFGHANCSAENLNEVLAFDQAIKVVLDFAAKHPDETLVIITGDHETGGMTMGFAGSGRGINIERLANQKISGIKFHAMIKEEKKKNPEFSFDDACKLLTEYYGFKFNGDKKDPMSINSKELALLKKGFEKGTLADSARIVMNTKAGVGWTTGKHTALPVLTTSTGVKAELFTGFIDNTDISKKIKSVL